MVVPGELGTTLILFAISFIFLYFDIQYTPEES